MSDDLFETLVGAASAERPPFRQAPEGPYVAVISSHRLVTANSGNKGIELSFTLQEYLGKGDLDGVNLAKARLRDTMWVTEKTTGFVAEKLARINSETEGKTIRDALEYLDGSEVVITVVHQTHDREGKELKTPYLEVKNYYTKDWYLANKMAA